MSKVLVRRRASAFARRKSASDRRGHLDEHKARACVRQGGMGPRNTRSTSKCARQERTSTPGALVATPPSRLPAAPVRSKPPPAGHLQQMGIPTTLPLELFPTRETTRCQSSSLGIALARSAGETHKWPAAPVKAECGRADEHDGETGRRGDGETVIRGDDHRARCTR